MALGKIFLALRGWLNSTSNKVGNPSDMGDVILQDFSKQLAETQLAVAQYKGQLVLHENELKDLVKERDENGGYIKKAKEKNQIDIAKKFAKKIQEIEIKIAKKEEIISSFQKVLSDCESKLQSMKEQEDSISERVDTLKAKTAVNTALEGAASILGKNSDVDKNLSDLEKKVNLNINTNEALIDYRDGADKELNDFKKEASTDSLDDILKRY